MTHPSKTQMARAHTIVEHVRQGPFDLAKQVQRLANVAEIAVALLLAERDRKLT
jgi:hypothetical protein